MWNRSADEQAQINQQENRAITSRNEINANKDYYASRESPYRDQPSLWGSDADGSYSGSSESPTTPGELLVGAVIWGVIIGAVIWFFVS